MSSPALGSRVDSTPCPASRNPTGLPCGIVYGPGGKVYERRTDGQTLKEIGLGLQLLDLNISGVIPLPGLDVTTRIGRQQVIWGEADRLPVPSIEDRMELVREVRPGAEFHIVAGAGHWVQFEAPGAVDALLIDFHKRVTS